MALYTLKSQDDVARMLNAPKYNPNSQNIYNAIGRDAGATGANTGGDNFFAKRGKSIENAFGTTGAAVGSWIYDRMENDKTDSIMKQNRDSLENIVKKYGYNSQDDFWNQKDQAEKEIYGKYGYDIDKYWNERSKIWSPANADSDAVKNLDAQRDQVIAGMNEEDAAKIRNLNNIESELRGQTATAAKEADDRAKAYEDYHKNNYISKKINQDRGKFAGSAINTLSTATDLTGLTSNPLGNAVQGGIEGIADELEQNGLENFDWQRAGQNAAIGATTGAVTGALNQGISNSLAKKGGNLFKGGNRLTQWMNKAGSETGLGQVGSTLATGAARGAISGAVGGATGAGLSAAMNNQDVLASALEGAKQGFGQGALTGATMAGANMAISKTPGVGDFYNELQGVKQKWQQSGRNFDERLTNTLNSGESSVGNWLNKRDSWRNTGNGAQDINARLAAYGETEETPTNTKDWIKKTGERVLEEANKRGVGLSIKDTGAENQKYDAWDRVAQQAGYDTYDDVIEAFLQANPDVEINPRGMAGQILSWMDKNPNNPYSNSTSSPTTAKGWLKKAGERIIEDANERGIGLSLKDVSKDNTKGMPEDVRNMKIRDYNANTDGEMSEYAGMSPSQMLNSMAQKAGFDDYTTAVRRFINAGEATKGTDIVDWMEDLANQNTKIDGDSSVRNMKIVNGNDSANVQEEPTNVMARPTAEEQQLNDYEAAALQRAAEETQPIATTTKKTVKNPETEIYETLTNNKTTTSSKLRHEAGLKLQKQYGTVDKPTAKATNAPETLQKIADAGFTKPADVERMADAITGSNGEVSKLVANLVATAEPVDTFSGKTSGQTLDDYIDYSISKNGLDGINEGKAVKSQINALMKSLPSRAEGSVSFADEPTDVFKMTQLLDAEAANYEGRSGMNYGTTNPDKLRAAKVIKDVSTLMKDRLYDTVDVNKALTPEVAQNLKAYSPNNKAWSDYVDNEIMTAKNVKDLRSVQSPWVRAKKIIDNGYMNSVTYGGRNGGTGAIPLTKRGIAAAVLDATVNSKPGLRLQAKALNKAADFVDSNQTQTTPTPTVDTASATTAPTVNTARVTTAPTDTQTTTTTPTNAIVASPTELANMTANYSPSTQIYNAIGRTEGLTNGEQARTADYLVNAAQEAEIVPNTGYDTSMYNMLTGASGATQAANTAYTGADLTQAGLLGMFGNTGNYNLDIIGGAMELALMRGDSASFDELSSIYKMMSSNLPTSNGKDYSDVTNWSSSDRSKLLSAQDAMAQIDQLEAAYNEATGGKGSNLAQGWLRSRAADISGGNWDPTASNYNNLAQSVGMGIVKNLINLGVTEADAQRYLQYLPALTDTKEQVTQKLDTLRNMYQSQINNLYSAYGA